MQDNTYSYDIEISILASVFYNNDTLSDLADILRPEDFYFRQNGDIFWAMLALFNKQNPIDEIFLASELKEKFNKEALDAVLASSGMIDAQKYALMLKELSNKRALLAIASSVPQTINELAIKDAIDKISADIFNLTNEKQAGLKDAKEATGQALETIKRLKEEGRGLIGISSGFTELDDKIQGLKNGDFIIIAARPGMGKTTFALNIVERVLKSKQGVIFFSLEMPAVQLMFRLFSSYTSINLGDIMKANLNDDNLETLSQTADEIANSDLYIYDSGNLTVHMVRAQLRRLLQKNANIKLCVIDYIGLMTNSSSFGERHLQIADISRQLKLLARELQIPIIALSQLNRSLESRANKRPMLSDLRESGAIEQDADIIIFVYRKDFYKEQEAKEQIAKAKLEGKSINSEDIFKAEEVEDAEIIIGKNRNGPTGVLDFTFDKTKSRFLAKIPEIKAVQTQSLADED